MGFSNHMFLSNKNNRNLQRKRSFLSMDKNKEVKIFEDKSEVNSEKKPKLFIKKTPFITRLWDWLK